MFPWLAAVELMHREAHDLFLHFDPRTVPVVLFDGQDTWLTGTEPGEDGWEHTLEVWKWPGRHPALTANTAVTLPGGVLAAGLLLPGLSSIETRNLAAILVHEAFHVWQAQHPSPAWEANELDALTYPGGQQAALQTRGEEALWLADALATGDWHPAARQALGWREIRQSELSAEHRQFEWRMETKEGLAAFVETSFLNSPPLLTLERALGCTPRQWAYHSGAALAHLLARTGTAWQRKVMHGQPLDLLLSTEIGGAAPTPYSHAGVREAAQAAALAHADQLARREADFAAQGGRRLQITSKSGLCVQCFDPLNIHMLGNGRVLHSRYLNLSGPDITAEITGGQVLTCGPHPLSVTSLDLSGLSEPEVQGGQWMVIDDIFSIRIAAERIRQTPEGWEAHLD